MTIPEASFLGQGHHKVNGSEEPAGWKEGGTFILLCGAGLAWDVKCF